jgi:hypothetical protein
MNISRVENTQLIENARRSKLEKRGNCAELEPIWNASFLLSRDDVPLLANVSASRRRGFAKDSDCFLVA